MERDADPLQTAFAPLIGLPAWSVQKGHGSFLTMEFGEPRLLIREPTVAHSASERIRARLARRMVKPIGEWYLWIYCCHWRVSSKVAQIAWSESSNDEIHAAAAEIDGQILTRVSADPGAGTSLFEFDLGASLQTWPWEEEKEEEQWSLNTSQSDNVFAYRGDGRYGLGPGDLIENERVWLPLRSSCANS